MIHRLRWRLQFGPGHRCPMTNCTVTVINGKTFTCQSDSRLLCMAFTSPFFLPEVWRCLGRLHLSLCHGSVSPSGAINQQNSVLTCVPTTSSVTVKYVRDNLGGKESCVSKRNGKWSWFLVDSEVLSFKAKNWRKYANCYVLTWLVYIYPKLLATLKLGEMDMLSVLSEDPIKCYWVFNPEFPIVSIEHPLNHWRNERMTMWWGYRRWYDIVSTKTSEMHPKPSSYTM